MLYRPLSYVQIFEFQDLSSVSRVTSEIINKFINSNGSYTFLTNNQVKSIMVRANMFF